MADTASPPATASDLSVQLGDNPPIPPLGVGTWAWGDSFYWGYGRGYDRSELKRAYQAALDAGVKLFDTAEIYGMGTSEQLIRDFADETNTSPQIATKFFPYPWRLTKRQLASALEGSLGRLGRESVELYQVHWPFPPRSVETWADALAKAHDQGLTRAVGVSNYSLRQMKRAQQALQKRGLRLASNQVEYSLLQRSPETTGLLKACKDMGVVLIAYSPLTQGLLTGKYDVNNPLPGLRGRRFNRNLEGYQPLIDTLREVADGYDKTPAQVSLNWLMKRGALVIPGAKNAKQAAQNAGALGWQLQDDDAKRLGEVAERVKAALS